MNHLTPTQILEIINGGEVPPHFNECDRCVKNAAALLEFGAASHGTFISADEVGKSSDCLDTNKIADYLESPEDGAVKAHLEKCDKCFDAAAYYYSESASMEKEELPDSPRRYLAAARKMARKKPARVIMPKLLERWIAVPLPAVASALLFLSVLHFSPSPEVVNMIRSTEVFTIYQKPGGSMPTFYFGESGKKVGTLPARMKVTPSGSYVRFDWADVKGVSDYYFVLQELRDNRPHIIKEVTTGTPGAIVKREMFKDDTVYRWIASGGFPPDSYFHARMEFTLK